MKNLNNIILIGPMATGKSSIGKEVSVLTGWKNYPVDKLKWYYRYKNGFDGVKSSTILQSKGFDALVSYSQKYFGIQELRDLINNFSGIIELGASDTHRNDLNYIRDINKLLEPYPNIFLILPYEDEDLSIEILTKRLRSRYHLDPLKSGVLMSYINKNLEFIRSPQNLLLAKHIIYTNDRPFHQIAQEIVYRSELKSKDTDYKNVI
ncbi:MAG: hypothetical protein HUJ25_03650 [Crocinitomicaceae bacterium]|nr:hypothetical protein [Crocinitomicaceae bacterium]